MWTCCPSDTWTAVVPVTIDYNATGAPPMPPDLCNVLIVGPMEIGQWTIEVINHSGLTGSNVNFLIGWQSYCPGISAGDSGCDPSFLTLFPGVQYPPYDQGGTWLTWPSVSSSTGYLVCTGGDACGFFYIGLSAISDNNQTGSLTVQGTLIGPPG